MFNDSKNLKMKEQIEELKNFISEMFEKNKEVKNVKILDSTEVNDKISSLENAISASEKTNEELSETLKKKESDIVALADEMTNLEAEVAKLKGTSSEVTPEKDPNPVVEDDSTPVNAWDSLAGSIINNKSIYLK
jgi:chromosome segregation ATPase